MWSKSTIFLEKVYPSAIWRIPVKDKSMFLTFDDGPHPEITPKVLDILDEYDAKATFFCTGKNVEKYPLVFDEIKKRGHVTGNHTYSHLNGWKTPNRDYFEDVKKASEIFESNLFRPPYGRISSSQLWTLKKKFRVIMWEVLSMDYSKKISKSVCLARVISNAREGSIIVFHDSEKAQENMFFALQNSMKYFSEQQFTFRKIEF